MDFLLLFWLICGLIAGYIYKRKGRSYGLGCVGGFLLGPIGIVLALVSGSNDIGLAQQQKNLEQRAIDRGEMKRCPYCSELIRSEAKICKHCQQQVA